MCYIWIGEIENIDNQSMKEGTPERKDNITLLGVANQYIKTKEGSIQKPQKNNVNQKQLINIKNE